LERCSTIKKKVSKFSKYKYLDPKDQDYIQEIDHAPEDDMYLSRKLEKIFPPIEKKWMELYGCRSFDNELPGKIFFRILISLGMKNKKIFFASKTIDMRNHFFWIQDTGSGKDQGMDFFMEMIERINKEYKRRTGVPSFIRSYEINGSETPEVFLDHFKTKTGSKGKEMDTDADPIPGILSRYDLIISRECSFLFREQNREKQSKAEYLLTAMEGRPLTKSLIKWEGNTSTTICNACIIGMTRPIANMKSHIVWSGLQQRAFNYARSLSKTDRMKMFDEVLREDPDEALSDFDSKCKNLAKKIVKLFLWWNKNDIYIKNEDIKKIYKIRKAVIFDLQEKISELPSAEHRDIMQGFVSRMIDKMIVLGYQNAIIRKSKVVEAMDIEISIEDFIYPMFESLIEWVEVKIESSKKESSSVKKTRRAIKMILKDKKPMPRAKLREALENILECTRRYALRRLSIELESKRSIIYENKKGEISLR